MSFEAIPEDREECYPCSCGGDITKDKKGHYWNCSKCDFKKLVLKTWRKTDVKSDRENKNKNVKN